MKPKLIVVGGEVKTKEVSLKLPTIIGRGRNVTLTLPHPLVSRRHCEIYEKNGQLIVRDLGSLNGTFVNNKRIEGEHPLATGELLTIGSVTFRAMYESIQTTDSEKTSDTQQLHTTESADQYQDRQQLIDKKTQAAEKIPAAQQISSNKPRSNPVPFTDNDEAELDINETIPFEAGSHVHEHGEIPNAVTASDDNKPADNVSLSAIEQLPKNPQAGASAIEQLSLNDRENG